MTHLASFHVSSTGTAAREPITNEILSSVRRHLKMPLAHLAVFDSGDVVYRAVSTDRRAPYFEAGDRHPAKGSCCKAVRDGRLPQLLPEHPSQCICTVAAGYDDISHGGNGFRFHCFWPMAPPAACSAACHMNRCPP
jgi:hypothetical protein